jgi:excisionase family DNA binding protein
MSDPGGPGQLVLDDWITPREAAEMLGVTQHHVRFMARAGTIEGRKFGYAWMIKRASVEAYAESYRHPGPKPREESSASD